MKKSDKLKKEKKNFEKIYEEIKPFINKKYYNAPSTAGKWKTEKPKDGSYKPTKSYYSLD